jgi:hypothetical protein
MQGKSADISQHIILVVASMVGISMTVMTLMQLAPKNRLSSFSDQLLAIDSLIFLVSTFLSYWNIRPSKASVNTEDWGDRLFLVGMAMMVLISFL